MSDKEQLELAAKALGWRVASYSERRSTGVVDGGMALVVAGGRTFGWSPLHDDGDALRLAVALRLDIKHYSCAGGVEVINPTRRNCGACSYSGDADAATRRAIVRAAAHIGASA